MTEFMFSITNAEDDAAELNDLYSAILDDRQLRAAKKSLAPGQPGAGQMGAEEVIRIVLENPGFYTAASTCVSAWLASRQSRLKVIIRANGSAEIEADGINPITATVVEQALNAARKEQGDEATR